METFYVAQGNEEEFTITIVDDDAAAIVSFSGTEPLTGAVWTGRQAAALFNPTVTWDDPAAGTVTLKISAAQSTAALPGLYFLKITVTDTVGPHDAFIGLLHIVASPGNTAAPAVYCSWDDLMTYAPQSPKLQSLSTDDTQFLPQRSKARQIFELWILKRYRPQPGRSRRYVDATGQAAGPYLCFAPPPVGSTVPTLAQVVTYLAANRLVVSEDVVRTNALLAASEIYLGQPGTNNIYQQLGVQALADAHDLFEATIIELDTDSNGLAELRIDRDVTFLT